MPTAIVTGASRGLGFENAKGLAALGYDIVMVAKDQSRLSMAQQSLQRHNPDGHFSTYAVDFEDLTATRATVAQIATEHSAPDALILADAAAQEAPPAASAENCVDLTCIHKRRAEACIALPHRGLIARLVELCTPVVVRHALIPGLCILLGQQGCGTLR